ncbi:MAG: hypothetical protein BIFFINMI_04153 [Phycisphaerae bacterium]|nr:hypothetical protein [Phycisphaerae bacterium]
MSSNLLIAAADAPDWAKDFLQQFDPAKAQQLNDQAMQVAAWSGLGLAVVGVLLLLFGVKLARLLVTMSFAAAGGGLGLLAGVAIQHYKSVPAAPLVGGIAGLLLVGLFGFLMYRFWMMIAFASLLGWAAGGTCLYLRAGDELYTQGVDLCDYVRQGVKGQIDLPSDGSVTIQNNKPADQDAIRREFEEGLKTRLTQLGQSLRPHLLFTSLAGMGGFVFGLLLGAFAFRLTVVLLTSLGGVASIVAGVGAFAIIRRPEWIHRAQEHWQAVAVVLGSAWLVGVIVQALLARRRDPDAPPPEAEPAA